MAKKIFQGLITLGFIGFFIYQQFFAYGSKVNFGDGEEVYYKGDATEAEAQLVGAELQRIEFFDGVGDASVQLVKRDGDFVVRFVTKDGTWTDPETQKIFGKIGWDLSQQAFAGKNVIVELCDSALKTKATVKMEKPRVDESKKLTFGGKNVLYYEPPATEDETKRLGQSLKDIGFFSEGGEAAGQLLKQDGGGYTLRLVANENSWADSALAEEFALAAWTISDSAFSGEPVTIELCDPWLETKATISMKEPTSE